MWHELHLFQAFSEHDIKVNMKDNQKSFNRNINQYTDQTASRVPLLATRFVWMFCSSTREWNTALATQQHALCRLFIRSMATLWLEKC